MKLKYSEAIPIMKEIAETLSLNLKKPSDFFLAAEKAERYILQKRKEAAHEHRSEPQRFPDADEANEMLKEMEEN